MTFPDFFLPGFPSTAGHAAETFSPLLIPSLHPQDNRVHIGPKMEMRVVVLGLDHSGKTSILFRLKLNDFIETIPTIGTNYGNVVR